MHDESSSSAAAVDDKIPVACISDDGQMCIINRGDLFQTLYDVREPDQARVIQTIDLLKEIKA